MATYKATMRTGTSRQVLIISVEDVDLAVVDEQGKPASGWYYRVTDPDGIALTGQLGEDGNAKVTGVRKGRCEVVIAPTPLDQKPSGAPPPPPPECPPVKGAAGDGPTARRRRADRPAP